VRGLNGQSDGSIEEDTLNKMQAYFNLIRRLVKAFEASGLDYAFTGAIAASFYGLPRTTTDVDLMVQVSDKLGKSRLVRSLARAGMRADEKEIDRALASGYRIVTFGDRKTAYSTDIIILNEKLQKRVGTVAGIQTFFQTPEDLILAKLRMIKATVPKERALKDKEDIRAILRFTVVDVEVIKKRAKKDTTLSIFEVLTA
jgi:hypothetical protein